MIAFVAVFVFVCLWKIQLKPADNAGYMTDYMSVDKTMAIKGIFILIVFFQHFNSYLKYSAPLDVMYFKYFNMIGQRMVTLFMLYSGYGVMESIKKKKMNYVHNIPVQRFLGTLFRFDIAVLLFLILDLILKRPFTLQQLLLSFTGWDSLGNSNWYIFMILVSYLFTFIAFEICRDKGNFYPGALLTLILLVATVVVFAVTEVKDRYWYDTVILYGIGMVWSLCRDKVERLINKNIFIWAVITAAVAAGEVISMKTDKGSFVIHEVTIILFAALIVLVTMRVSFNNKILRWFGKHLFGVYIIQRIPMIILKETGVMDLNIYLSFAVAFSATVIIAYVFDKYLDKLWKIIASKLLISAKNT